MVESVDTEVEVNNEAPPQIQEREAPSTERRSVRESLEKTFKDAHTEEEREVRRPREPKRDANKQRDGSGKFVATEEAPEVSDERTEVPEEGAEPEVKEVQPVEAQAPAAWTKDAKAEWAKLPEQVRAAVLKREQDTEKGVKELKSKYEDIEKAIAPHVPAIQQFGKTPAQAVEQLFAWFQALAQNPDQAIPALIQSYNYDPKKLVQAFGLQVQPQAQEQVKPDEAIDIDLDPQVKSYISKLEEKINGLQTQVGQQLNGVMSTFQEQSMAKTHEVLNNWAKDKPYFAEVRTLMGQLLTPDPNTGMAAVPLKEGRVDLDAAYDMAVYANPAIRAKVLADQQAKADQARKAKAATEAKAQTEAAEKARRASGSLAPSTPGSEASRKATNKGKSVRESIMAAREELNS